jgi:hypothetical protein
LPSAFRFHLPASAQNLLSMDAIQKNTLEAIAKYARTG